MHYTQPLFDNDHNCDFRCTYIDLIHLLYYSQLNKMESRLSNDISAVLKLLQTQQNQTPTASSSPRTRRISPHVRISVDGDENHLPS